MSRIDSQPIWRIPFTIAYIAADSSILLAFNIVIVQFLIGSVLIKVVLNETQSTLEQCQRETWARGLSPQNVT